jgi:hypothetical protein
MNHQAFVNHNYLSLDFVQLIFQVIENRWKINEAMNIIEDENSFFIPF